MNRFLAIVTLILLAGYTNNHKAATRKSLIARTTPNSVAVEAKQYNNRQLEAFLDSIGHLSQQALMHSVAAMPDSAFRSQIPLDTLLCRADFDTLKWAALKGVMLAQTARRIFRNKDISDSCNTASVLKSYKVGLIPVIYYPFSANKHAFKEFAVSIGDEWHCGNAILYFFSGNRIIARDEGYNRDGLELDHYRDADGKTIVYYNRNFGTGSGTWWDQFNFYKYENNRLIPVLDELENGNIQPPFFRARWLESTILSTRPLTIKMVYYQSFTTITSLPDTTYYNSSTNFIDDSTIVRYAWDEQSKMLKGNYEQSKLNKAQIMTYYPDGNEYLFINSYYKLLKHLLKDDKQREWVLAYLNKVRDYGSK